MPLPSNAHTGVSALARSLGVSDQSVRTRVRRGLTLEQAAEEIRENARRRAAGLPVHGKAPVDYMKALEGREYVPARRGKIKTDGPTVVSTPVSTPSVPPVGPTPTSKPDSRYPNLAAFPDRPANGDTVSSIGPPASPVPRFTTSLPDMHIGMARDEMARAQAFAQVLKEQGLAAQAQFRAQEMDGKLIDRAAVYQGVSNVVVKARDILTRIGPEQRDRLAATSDPVECERIVMGEILRALEVLTLYTASIAAGQ